MTQPAVCRKKNLLKYKKKFVEWAFWSGSGFRLKTGDKIKRFNLWRLPTEAVNICERKQ